ncbi:MAG: DUF6404 family protein [Pseudomonadota bacterium]
MTEYERKFAAATAELAQTKMWPGACMPLSTRLMRRLGLPVRPPHYTAFGFMVLSAGLRFAVVWGAIMWVLRWQPHGFAPTSALGASLLIGLIFGLIIASMYRRDRRLWRLSAWRSL